MSLDEKDRQIGTTVPRIEQAEGVQSDIDRTTTVCDVPNSDTVVYKLRDINEKIVSSWKQAFESYPQQIQVGKICCIFVFIYGHFMNNPLFFKCS